MFNNKSTIEINKKLEIARKLLEQQVEIRKREIQQAEDRQKIEDWWTEEQKKIVAWTPEYRAFMEKHTFTPNDKTNERTIRSMTNTWKKLENR
jgi:peptidyl-tRNA hydrolase